MDIINNSNKFVKMVGETKKLSDDIRNKAMHNMPYVPKAIIIEQDEQEYSLDGVEETPLSQLEIENLEYLKEMFPGMEKKARRKVARFIANLTFDEVESLTPDDLMKIKGIGEKYAKGIINMRWDLSAHLLKAGSYEAALPPKAKMVAQKKFQFNQNWNPVKDARKSIATSIEIMRTQSELDEFVISLGVAPSEAFITVVGYIKSSGKQPTRREEIQEDVWNSWCNNGTKANGGCRYVFGFHGTNAGRKDTVLGIREDIFDKVIEFASNKANLEGISTEAKLAAYLGLTMPGTVALKDCIGLDIPVESFVLVPEYKKVFKNQHVDFVDIEAGVVSLDVIRDVIQNMFDGQLLFHVSNKKLTELTEGMDPKERLDIMHKLAELVSFTLRGSWLKGLAITAADFHSILRAWGIRYVIDKFGRKVDIDDIVFLADESVCKASFGENGNFKSWIDFCTNWKSFNRGFRVLVTEHADRPHALPFQQLQSLVGGDEEAMLTLIQEEIDYLKSLNERNNAIAMLGGEIAKIVAADNGMLKHPWVMKRIEQIYEKLIRQTKGGVLHRLTHYCFIACDPIAMLQHIAWACSDRSEELRKQYPNEEDFVRGVVAANHVITDVRFKGEEGKGVMSRNPSTDPQAQIVVEVDRDFGEYAKYFKRSTLIYTSVNDYNVTRIRGDHDGDHVFLTFKKLIVKMAETANAKWGGRLIDWDAPATKKHAITRQGMIDYFCSLTQISQLGHWCDMLTSLIGYGEGKYNHAVACWLVMAVNVYVDASKHGMGSVDVPKFVIDFLTAKEKDGTIKKDDKGRTIMRYMPKYAMLHKDANNPEGEVKHINSARCCPVWGQGNGDRLSLAAHAIPQSPEIDMEDIEMYDVNNFLYDYQGLRNGGKSFGLRGCSDLFYPGEFNEETGKYENQGLWLEIVFERSRDLDALQKEFAGRDDDRFALSAAKKSRDLFRRYAALKRLTEWAALNEKTLEDIHDAVTFWTLKELKYPKTPIRGRYEEEEEFVERMKQYEKRVNTFNIKFEGWIAVFGGMTLQAAYRHNGVDTSVVVESAEDMSWADDVLDD